MSKEKNILAYGENKGYLVIGEVVTPQDNDYEHLKDLVDGASKGQAVVRVTEEQMIDFLSTQISGSDLVKKVLERVYSNQKQ